MRCISVYTKDFAIFSDLYEEIINTPLQENEEKSIEGIVFSDSGEVDEAYVNRLKQRSEVAVMKLKHSDVMILQHGEVFEIILPEQQIMVH